MGKQLELQIVLRLLAQDAINDTVQLAAALNKLKVTAGQVQATVTQASEKISAAQKKQVAATKQTVNAEKNSGTVQDQITRNKIRGINLRCSAIKKEQQEINKLILLEGRLRRVQSAGPIQGIYGLDWQMTSAEKYADRNQRTLLAEQTRQSRAAERAQKAQERARARELYLNRRAGEELSRSSWQRSLMITTTGLTVGMTLQQAGTYTVQNILKPSLESAGEFERRMKDIGFIIGDYTGMKFKKAEQYIKDFSRSSVWELGKVQDSLYELLSAGLSLDTAQAVMPAIYGFSLFTGNRQGPGEIAKMMTSIYNKFSTSTPYLGTDKGKAFAIIADQLAKTVNISKFDPEEIATFANAVGMTGPRYGIPLHEMLGIGAMVKQFGLSAAQSGEYPEILFRRSAEITKQWTRAMSGGDIRKFMMNLGAGPKEMGDLDKWLAQSGGGSGGLRKTTAAKTIGGMLASLNINPFRLDKAGRPAKGGIEWLAEIVDSLKNYNDQLGKTVILNTLFGEYGGQVVEMVRTFHTEVERGGKVVTLYGTEALREFAKQIKESSGLISSFRTEYEALWTAIIKKYDNAKDRLKAIFGTSMIPVVAPIVDSLTDAINAAAAFLDKYPVIASVIGSIGGSMGVTMLVVGTLATAFFGLASALSLTYYFTREAGIQLGGAASAFSLMFNKLTPVLNELLRPLGMTLSGIAFILKSTFVGAIVFAIAYMTNLGGTAEWVNEKIRAVKLVWMAFTEWRANNKSYSRATLAALLGFDETGTQKYASVLGFFQTLADMWMVLESIYKGIYAGVSDVLQIISPAIHSVIELFGTLWDIFVSFFPSLKQGEKGFKLIQQIAYVLTRTVLYIVQPLAYVAGLLASILNTVLKYEAVKTTLQWIAVALAAWYIWSFALGKVMGLYYFGQGLKFIAAMMWKSILPMNLGTAALFLYGNVLTAFTGQMTLASLSMWHFLLLFGVLFIAMAAGRWAWATFADYGVSAITHILRAVELLGTSLSYILGALTPGLTEENYAAAMGLPALRQHIANMDKYDELSPSFNADMLAKNKATYDSTSLLGWIGGGLGLSSGPLDMLHGANALYDPLGSGMEGSFFGLGGPQNYSGTYGDESPTIRLSEQEAALLAGIHGKSGAPGVSPGTNIGRIQNQFTFNIAPVQLTEYQLEQALEYIRREASNFGLASVPR
jgi:TP901 family phage tail tape measure protein